MKLDAADIAFSKWIRLRDMKCMRCGSPVELNAKGMPVSHQASHFWGRGKEATRFDPENVTTHCSGCHRFLTAHPLLHVEWKKSTMTPQAFDALTIRSNTYKKKDRKFEAMIWREALKKLDK